MTMIRRKPPAGADEDLFATQGAPGQLAPARLRVRRLSRGSLLWMIPAAAALAGLLVFVIDSAGEPGEVKPAVVEAPASGGPTATASIGRSPARGVPERGSDDKAQPRPGPSPQMSPGPAASAAPTAGDRASSQPARPVAPAPSQAQAAEPSRVAALPAPAAETRPSPSPARLNLSGEEIAAHLARGEERLKAGELAAARLYFERVALAGDSRGALGMARSYDPAVLAGLPVLGPQADPAAAKRWYERAGSQRKGG